MLKKTNFRYKDFIAPFYYQLLHIMLKNTELLKHSKIAHFTTF